MFFFAILPDIAAKDRETDCKLTESGSGNLPSAFEYGNF